MAYKSLRLALALLGVANALPTPAVSDVIPGQYIVTLRPEVGHELELHTRWVSDVHREGLRKRGGDTVGVENKFDIPGFHAYAGSFDDETLAVIRANSSVLRVEEDKIIRLSDTQTSPPWGLSAISNPKGYAANAPYNYDSTAGSGIFAYVIDSGILLTHNEFQGRAVAGYSTGRSTDRHHGTLVAAIVGGVTYGVAKKVTLVDVQVMDGETGSTSSVLAGIQWAVNDVKAKGRANKSVANMSLGGSNSATMNNAVQAMVDAGITVAVAAGNEGRDASSSSPANQPNVITVGAADSSYRRASFSNYGVDVDIFSPGVQILTADSTSNSATYTSSGTSEAAPHVAGVAAYLLGKEGAQTPAQVRARIVDLALKNVVTDPKGSADLFLHI
ncbi:peptidase S8/S53 domain-containing protein [Microdochium trichocladiopsis]|uniref:Peptidase S8/S53 domain-containing protein n=1 Tax=Microdochium trichocladiopsis TaxID=1682393 RepID=A0A9P9BUF8_9PEZI|nr:peptidase S8/S53 domain-containing protein [Microdochium trichocladiopsis]KAH7040946.1 peptidase S8/S53 domain-containing protein [Microdochium trichocladiopsis]